MDEKVDEKVRFAQFAEQVHKASVEARHPDERMHAMLLVLVEIAASLRRIAMTVERIDEDNRRPAR